MIVVALGLVAALLITVTAFASLIRSQQREHNRRENLLLNQLLHAAGKTWMPPPEVEKPVAPDVPWAPVPVRFTATPEQYPV